jgi:Cys-tRNA(Pro) deacylase
MNDTPPVSRALAELNIPHRVFRHPGRVASLEQAAEERGQRPEQVIRSLVFRVATDEYVMVLAAGSQQVSWRSLRRYLGQSRLTTATEEEVMQVTGYERGAVGPFGLPAPMRILADKKVFAPDEVSIGSGVRSTTVILKTADLRRALPNMETGTFVV